MRHSAASPCLDGRCGTRQSGWLLKAMRTDGRPESTLTQVDLEVRKKVLHTIRVEPQTTHDSSSVTSAIVCGVAGLVGIERDLPAWTVPTATSFWSSNSVSFGNTHMPRMARNAKSLSSKHAGSRVTGRFITTPRNAANGHPVKQPPISRYMEMKDTTVSPRSANDQAASQPA